jgi:hypothetical protein
MPSKQAAQKHASEVMGLHQFKAGMLACPGRHNNHCEDVGCRQTLKMN